MNVLAYMVSKYYNPTTINRRNRMRKNLIRMIATLSVIAVVLAFAGVVRAAGDTNAAQTKPVNKAIVHDATGTITAVDAKAGTLSIKGRKNAGVTFTIAKDCKVSIADKKDPTVADLKVGDKVTVTYTEEGGVNVAQKIGQPTAHVPKNKGAAK